MTETAAQLEAKDAAGAGASTRVEDLAQIIRAYNEVTEKLQASHETLKGEVHRLRRELASTNAQLQRSKRLSALGEMAAGMAHEIRNPLAAIQLYAKMVVEDLSGEASGQELDAARENAGKIASAVRGLNGIVNDVLSFSRELQVRVSDVSALELLHASVESHRPAIDAAGVEVRVEVAEDEGLTFAADRDLMQQALVNLIRNAVDAMGGADERVLEVGASVEEGVVTLMVRDSGPGIADADVDRIFNPFFTTRNTGTGLGLAIVHRIVDAHGGSVVVHNERGAVFGLSLPQVAEAGAADSQG